MNLLIRTLYIVSELINLGKDMSFPEFIDSDAIYEFIDSNAIHSVRINKFRKGHLFRLKSTCI